MGKRYCTLSSLYLLCTTAVSNKPWLVTSIVLWLSTVLCPIFVANPRPEREGYIRSPVERLDAPAQLSRVYPTSCTCDNIPGFPPRIVESLGTRLVCATVNGRFKDASVLVSCTIWHESQCGLKGADMPLSMRSKVPAGRFLATGTTTFFDANEVY